MSSIKIELSKKQIISIKEFMINYLEKEYTGDRKLTHKEMQMFLWSKGIEVPQRVNFERVKKEHLLTGDYLAVKDECSQILFYKNPNRLKLSCLLNELQSQTNTVELIGTNNQKQLINKRNVRKSHY